MSSGATKTVHNGDPHWRTNVAEPKIQLASSDDGEGALRLPARTSSTIYKLLRRGELPGFRIGTDWRFNAEVIDKWCLERNMRPAEEAMRGN